MQKSLVENYIYIELHGIDCWYQAEEIARLYYRGVIRDKSSNSNSNNDCLVISLSDNILHTKIIPSKISQDNSSISASINVKSLPIKELKWEVKRQVYKILSKYHGEERPWGILTGVRPSKKVHTYLKEGMNKQEILNAFINEDFVSEEKARLLYEVGMAERRIMESAGEKEVLLYVGIPFCPSICRYCSFSSYPIAGKQSNPEAYLKAMELEIDAAAEILSRTGEYISCIYIGGGTPTSLTGCLLRRLMEMLQRSFDFGNVREFTVEAGRPDTITEEKLRVLKEYGVTRISINPQTTNNKTLERIGRSHTAEEFFHAFALARKHGFGNINTDIIAGLPGEGIEDVRNTLADIKRFLPESLTVHALAVKRGAKINSEIGFEHTNRLLIEKMFSKAHQAANDIDMKPYYLYRQKNIAGHQENIGFCIDGKECEYNIHIMEEKQSVYSLGAGGVTKICNKDTGKVERIFNFKDPKIYTGGINEMIRRKSIIL